MRVFANGKFISCEDENRIFSILVEENGRIAYTGDTLPDRYKTGNVIDLGGACVTPCFGDTHLHFISTCFLPLDVRGCKNIPEVLAKISEYIKTDHEKVIQGFGISAHTMEEKRLPTRQELDSVTDRPLALGKYDGHAGIVNSALIALLPPELQNHPQLNKETGECYSDAFQLLCAHSAKMGYVTPKFIMNNIPRVMDMLAKKGINLILPVEGLEGDSSPYDLTVGVDGQTPIRVLPFFQTMDIKEAMAKECRRVGGCFASQLDGCFGAEDAALREPYTSNPESSGWLLHSQETVNEFIKKANRAGMHLAIHAIGDAAIEQLIIAFEEALRDYPQKDHRHAIIHGDLFPKEYLERAGKLGLYCAVQTPFLTWPEEPLPYLVQVIGQRAYEKHPLPLMIDAGLTLANGSDNPSSQVDPIMGLYSSCNHPNPAYSVDIITALRMHTLNTAKFAFTEKDMGSLTVGKVADFVVFDRDLTETPREQLLDVKITDVYYGGRQYQSGQFKIRQLPLLWSVIKGKLRYNRNIKKL
ncbi:MAG: amidohydrolase family protein [Angelakisella sp.]